MLWSMYTFPDPFYKGKLGPKAYTCVICSKKFALPYRETDFTIKAETDRDFQYLSDLSTKIESPTTDNPTGATIYIESLVCIPCIDSHKICPFDEFQDNILEAVLKQDKETATFTLL